MIDLFRPFMAEQAALFNLAQVFAADEHGRRYIGQGRFVDEFERRFAALVGAPDPDTVVSTNSCTSALGIALQLAGVVPGDEVIAPPMTCTATSGAIVNAGARIVWADISPRSGLIDPADVARKITPKTGAIVAVDWGGAGCDYAALRAHDLPVIEDAAHSLLAFETGTDMWGEPLARVGGDYVCYSLGPIKHLTCGDGGMLVTRRGDQDRARLLRWHGLDRRSSADFRCGHQTIAEPGGKHHMTDIDAAIGLANIEHAEWVVARHRLNAEYYHRALAVLPGVQRPFGDRGSSWWLYCLLVEDRDAFIAHMAAAGIQTSPVHKRNDIHPAYHFPNGPLPGVDHYDAHVVAIPVGWWIDEAAREKVAGAVIEWAHGRREAA